MKFTNRHLAFIGLAIGGLGLAFEWKNIFPGGLSNPLVNRNVGTTPATGRSAVSATQSTTGRPSPSGTTTRAAGAGAPAGRSSGGSTLSLGSVLTPIASILGGLMKGLAPTKPDSRSSGGGGAAPSSPGGSAGRVDAGRGAPFSNDNTSNTGGAGPTQSSPYVDGQGFVAYPNGDGTYADEWGNQVYVTSDGSITYDATQDVGYVAGGEVFPNSYDPSDPSTFDFYGDGGPLAAPDPVSPAVDATFWPDGGPLADPTITIDDGVPDLGGVDPASFADTGVSDLGGDFGGGGDGSFSSDNMDFSDGF